MMNAIRKGQINGIKGGNIIGQKKSNEFLFEIAV